MKDFDELLREVLGDRTDSKYRAGVEGRILARAVAGRVRSRRRWIMWTAAATSALLAGVIVRTVTVSASLTRRADPPISQEGLKVASGLTNFGNVTHGQPSSRLAEIKPKTDLKRAGPLLPEGSDRMAQIEIAPLSIEPIAVASQGWNQKARKVKTDENILSNTVLVCDGGFGGSNGAAGKAPHPCGYSLVSYAILSGDAGAEVFSEPRGAAGPGHSEHHY